MLFLHFIVYFSNFSTPLYAVVFACSARHAFHYPVCLLFVSSHAVPLDSFLDVGCFVVSQHFDMSHFILAFGSVVQVWNIF